MDTETSFKIDCVCAEAAIALVGAPICLLLLLLLLLLQCGNTEWRHLTDAIATFEMCHSMLVSRARN